MRVPIIRISRGLPAPPVMAVGLTIFLCGSCSKKDSQASPSTPTTVPATTQAKEDALVHPAPEMRDPRAQPAVYLAVNHRSSTELAQGWPLFVEATFFGGRDQPITVNPDEVTLTITDEKGAPVNWPIKRAPIRASTQPATGVSMMANDSKPAHLSWVVADSTSIPLGSYYVAAKLRGAGAHAAGVKVVAPAAQANDDQQSARWTAGARAALTMGDAQTALDQADQRLKTKPTDLPALHVRADALAALERSDDAIAAYSRALDQFYAQYPNAPEPPTTLLRGLKEVSRGQ